MRLNNFLHSLIIYILSFSILIPILNICANAYEEKTHYDIHDCYSYAEFFASRKVWKYLRDNDLISDKVSFEDMEYDLVLAEQLAQSYSHLSPGIIMGIISVESKFNPKCRSNSGALGLMQIIPCYHEDRMKKFLEDETVYSKDLFYNSRLNIVTGTDYIGELLQDFDGNVELALMCYNQGVVSGSKDYDNGYISDYAKEVVRIAYEVDGYFNMQRG